MAKTHTFTTAANDTDKPVPVSNILGKLECDFVVLEGSSGSTFWGDGQGCVFPLPTDQPIFIPTNSTKNIFVKGADTTAVHVGVIPSV